MADSPKDDTKGVQLPLPFGDQAEYRQFFDILIALEKGELTPEKAPARFMMLHQIGMGALVRAIAESRPEVARVIVERLKRDLAAIDDTYRLQAKGADDTIEPPKLDNRASATLKRERAVLSALQQRSKGANRTTWTLAELLEAVAKVEPDITDAALTANLDRLVRDRWIEKRGKGHYAASDRSRVYAEAVERQLAMREAG